MTSMGRKFAAVLCSTLLLSPGWLGGTGFTLLFGLVPLLWISDSYDASRRSWWKVFGWALLTFVLWNVSTIWWIWLATPVGPFAATIASSFLNMVAFMLFHTVSKKGPKALAYTLLVSGWIATEYWYTTGDFSWPWLLLGNGFSHEVWAVQWYEYTGIFGGTLWVLLSNILLYEAWRRRRDAKAWTWAGAVVLLPILVSLGIFWSYEAPDEGSVTVSVVQPNIDCYDKFAAGTEQMQERLLLSMIEEAPAGSDFIVLPETAVPGTLAKDYYNIKSDYVLEVDITPNRADACSHYGVARDLYAYLVQNGKPAALKKPSVEAFAVDNHDLDIRVTVENSEACPHYAGVTVKGVTVKESPEWLQNKLRIIGLRPINNVVDITNYIVHAFGQPLHCFDADRIKGGEVIVKTLPEGTPFTTLGGVERKLNGRDLMICNREEPMCIAGVFGGLDSGSTETTKDVFLESAYFHPTWVRKTARRHGLNTDASFRFERGVDPNATLYCLKLAALMVKELAGGTISSDIKDVCAAPARDFRVELSYGKVHALIGKEIPAETIKSIVTSLEMKIVGETEEGLTLDVPPYRVDVQRDCDVIEDILRIYGYNNVEIPTALKSSLTTKGECDKSNRLQNLVAEQLVGCGFNEILNNSLHEPPITTDWNLILPRTS